MEVQVESPIKLNVYSSDKTLIPTNITVSVHPRTEAFRLLQYIHFILYRSRSENISTVYDVSNYCLEYNGRVLSPDSRLKELDPAVFENYTQLHFERIPNLSGSAFNLDYDPELDFTAVNIRYMVNTMSRSRFLDVPQHSVSLSTKVSKLEKTVLENLCNFESNFGEGNICKLKYDHSFNDLLGFKFKGQHSITELTDETRDYFMDYSIRDYLNIDFAPTTSSIFTVMFFAKHEQEYNTEKDTIKIELISNFKLFQKYIVVDEETTVMNVKEFVCGVCGSTETITSDDVKLIFKGQLVRNTNFAGRDATIMSYVNSHHGAKLHVQLGGVETEISESFWNEPCFVEQRHINASEILDSYGNDQLNETEDNYTNPDDLMDIQIPNTVDTPAYKYITEVGENVEIIPNSMVELDGRIYYKCLLNGEPVLVDSRGLDPFYVTMNIQSTDISVCMSPLRGGDYIIDGNTIKINPNAINELEIESGLKFKFNEELTTTEIIEESNVNPVIVNQRRTILQRVWYIILRFIEFLNILFFTFLYVLRGSFFPLCLVMQFGAFIPAIITFPLLVIYTIRLLFTRKDITYMWIDFFGWNILNDEDYINVKEFVDSGAVSAESFEKYQKNEKIFSVFILPSLEDVRLSIYANFGINQMGNMTDLDSLKELFRRIHSENVDMKEVCTLLQRLFQINDNHGFTEKEQLDFNRILPLLKQEMESGDLERVDPVRRTYLIVRTSIIEFPKKLIEKIVPHPLHDDFVVAIIKNILLFIILLIPYVNKEVDKVIKKRQEEIHEAEANQDIIQDIQPALVQELQNEEVVDDVERILEEDVLEEVFDDRVEHNENTATVTGMNIRDD